MTERAPWPVHAAMLAGAMLFAFLMYLAEPENWRGALLLGALLAGLVLWRWWSELNRADSQ